MKHKMNFNFKELLRKAEQLERPAVALALLAIFAFTSWEINSAVNVKPSSEAVTSKSSVGVSFSKTAIADLQGDRVKNNSLTPDELNRHNPFTP